MCSTELRLSVKNMFPATGVPHWLLSQLEEKEPMNNWGWATLLLTHPPQLMDTTSSSDPYSIPIWSLLYTHLNLTPSLSDLYSLLVLSKLPSHLFQTPSSCNIYFFHIWSTLLSHLSTLLSHLSTLLPSLIHTSSSFDPHSFSVDPDTLLIQSTFLLVWFVIAIDSLEQLLIYSL